MIALQIFDVMLHLSHLPFQLEGSLYDIIVLIDFHTKSLQFCVCYYLVYLQLVCNFICGFLIACRTRYDGTDQRQNTGDQRNNDSFSNFYSPPH